MDKETNKIIASLINIPPYTTCKYLEFDFSKDILIKKLLIKRLPKLKKNADIISYRKLLKK
tara:strand:- start:584 stop:766 length:183 start_codon:yes stop_codon:yes gene_type:complete